MFKGASETTPAVLSGMLEKLRDENQDINSSDEILQRLNDIMDAETLEKLTAKYRTKEEIIEECDKNK